MAATPTVICSDVQEVIYALQQGSFVICDNGRISRLYHAHVTQSLTGGCSSRTQHPTDLLQGAQVIHVDLSSRPPLLHDWSEIIETSHFSACRCSLKARALQKVTLRWTYSPSSID